MLEFFKQLFGAKASESTPAPYKIENTVPQVAEFPFPAAKPAVSKKKSVAKKAPVKPRKPKGNV
jgi:hypothetical protein